MNAHQHCGQCFQYADKFGRKYRGKRYCMPCYLYFFIKRTCSHCGKLKRIHRAEKKPLCYDCYSALTPCVRCHRVGRPVGRIESFGLLCNSCANVVSTPRKSCTMCGKVAFLSTDKKAGTNKPICQSCRYKMYPKCNQCGKKAAPFRISGNKSLCCRCANRIDHRCSQCGEFPSATNDSLCRRCSAVRLNERRASFNAGLLTNEIIKSMFLEFVEWLLDTVGPIKAATTQNKTFEFFKSLEHAPQNWENNIEFIATLNGGYFRQSSLIKRYLDTHNIKLEAETLRHAMDLRTIYKNIESIQQLCPENFSWAPHRFISKRLSDCQAGKVSLRTVRVETSAIKHLFEEYCALGNIRSALIQLAASSPGLKCCLSAYLNTIQISWPSEEAGQDRERFLTTWANK